MQSLEILRYRIGIHLARFVRIREIAVSGILIATSLSLFAVETQTADRSIQIPAFSEVRSSHLPSDAILLDRNGIKLQTIRVNPRIRNLEWWNANAISPYLQQALIVAEDRLFYEHKGIDGLAFFRAVFGYLTGSSYRGASTISMQVASLLQLDLRDTTESKSVTKKIRQINAAIDLESKWSKEEILSYYINHVPMRGELVGIPAASYAHFGIPPSELNPFQSLILSAMVRSPNADLSILKARASQLAARLNWKFREEDWEKWIRSGWFDPSLSAWKANHAYHYTKMHSNGKPGIFRSSLDSSLQLKVNSILKSQLLQLRSKNVHDGGVLVIDNETGEVVAYSGGIFGVSGAVFLDSVLAKRQAGSSLKPFLYALAIEKRYLTSTSLLSDTPLNLDVLQGVYRPSNYDRQYRGNVKMKIALGSSLNIPAVRTILLTGVPEFHQFLNLLGFRYLREADYYGYSLALGTADIRLYDLTRAYSVLGRMGLDLENRRILSPSTSFIVSYILADREARSLGFGLENYLSTRFFSAVKTGTSQDMRDNWCVGYNRKYTVGVWMGNLNGEPMQDVTGITGAAPVWREIMESLYEDALQKGGSAEMFEFSQDLPDDLVSYKGEYYLPGTEPHPEFSAFSEYEAPQKILYPTDGIVFTVDPDIPPSRQKVMFQFSGSNSSLYWYLNDRRLKNLGKDLSWTPVPGLYKLEVRDLKGKVYDSVKFVVR